TQWLGHSDRPRTQGVLADVLRGDFDNGEIRDDTNVQERFGARTRKRLLLILSARILDSSVERGIPNRAAAPEAPNTRPPVARNAPSTIAFSCAASELDNPTPVPNRRPRWDNQLSSTVNSWVSETITDRSMTFCSS